MLHGVVLHTNVHTLFGGFQWDLNCLARNDGCFGIATV